MKHRNCRKKWIWMISCFLCMMLTFTAVAEGFDVAAYSYEELLSLRDSVNARIAEMERQYAIENGNREITFEQAELVVFKGKTHKLSPSVRRVVDDAPEKTSFVYSSSDPEIAKVSKEGVVTGVSYGNCVITCTASDDEFIFCELPVQVALKVEDVTLNHAAAELLLTPSDPLKAQLSLKATVSPENAYVQTVVWSSSDESVATVDANGNVQAHAPGKVTIMATSEEDHEKDKNGKKKKACAASCEITVNRAVEEIVFAQSTELLAVGSSFTMEANVLPEDASVKKVLWESANPEILSISEKGTATGKSTGTVEVFCTAADGSGIIAKQSVQVYERVKSLKLDAEQGTLLLTEQDENLAKMKLTALIEPANALNQKVVWTSSDETIATVDENGNVQALAPGSVTITATSQDDPGKDKNGKQKKPYSASCKLTVGRAVNKIVLNQTDLLMNKGKKTSLTAEVLPEDASNKTYTWESSNPSIVSVTNKGQLTAKACGTARIICKANDGSGVQAVCDVKVIQMVTNLKTGSTTLAVTKGKSRQLSVQVEPSDATTKKLIWSSSNSSVATVDENGKVTALKKGTAEITVNTTDGSNVKKTIKVYVEPVESIRVESISWKAMLGIVKKSLSVEATNYNQFRTVKGFDFTVKCTDSSGYSSTNFLSWEGKKIKPGSSLNDRYQSGLSGFGYARKLEVTVTTIYFTDGTSETIPYDERYTSTFRF